MEIKAHQKTALLFGASGLVGGYVLRQLLDHPAYRQVVSFGRRELELAHPKLLQRVIDFEHLDKHSAAFQGHDVYSCLGTTMAKAGSKDAFYRVDYTYAYETAKRCAEAGANQLMLVSSVGADVDSLFYYSRVKGELEQAIQELPYWGLHIFQPSLLLGPRQEQRFAEQLATKLTRKLAPLMNGQRLGPYRPIEAEDVARAMIASAQGLQPGQFRYSSQDIFEIAQSEQKLLQ